jgi:hypothetical protein
MAMLNGPRVLGLWPPSSPWPFCLGRSLVLSGQSLGNFHWTFLQGLTQNSFSVSHQGQCTPGEPWDHPTAGLAQLDTPLPKGESDQGICQSSL